MAKILGQFIALISLIGLLISCTDNHSLTQLDTTKLSTGAIVKSVLINNA